MHSLIPTTCPQECVQGPTAPACSHPTSRTREQILTPAVPPLFSADQSLVERLPKRAWLLHPLAWRGPASSPSSRRELKPVPLLTTPSAHSPAPSGDVEREELGPTSVAAHVNGQRCRQATRPLAAPQPVCWVSQAWSTAGTVPIAAGESRTRAGSPACPRGPAHCCRQSRPGPPRSAGVEGDVCSQRSRLLFMQGVRIK